MESHKKTKRHSQSLQSYRLHRQRSKSHNVQTLGDNFRKNESAAQYLHVQSGHPQNMHSVQYQQHQSDCIPSTIPQITYSKSTPMLHAPHQNAHNGPASPNYAMMLPQSQTPMYDSDDIKSDFYHYTNAASSRESMNGNMLLVTPGPYYHYHDTSHSQSIITMTPSSTNTPVSPYFDEYYHRNKMHQMQMYEQMNIIKR